MTEIAPLRLLCAWLLCLVLAPSAHAKCTLKSFDIPVTMSGLRAVATLKLNGVEMPMTVDSGAFFSAITEPAAQQLKLRTRHLPDSLHVWGLTGSVAYRLTSVERLGLQNAEVRDVEFLVGGNEPGGGTMGLIGRNLLAWADAEYDLPHGVIRLVMPSDDCAKLDLAYWAGSTPVAIVPMRSSHPRDRYPAIKATAQINGKPVNVLFDTGAMSILSLRAARRVGLLDDEQRKMPAGSVMGAGRGQVPSWIVPVESFELGEERINNSRLRVADFDLDDADMLIGIDFFLSHRIYVASSQKRMFFTYSGGPVFDLSAQAATAPLADDTLSKDAPADAAGYARRGAAYAARRDFAHALSDLDRACEMAPTTSAYFAQRARIRAQTKDLPGAMADLDHALQVDSGNDEARLDRAGLRLAAKETQPALDDLVALEATVPASSNMRRAMGDMYMALGQTAPAVAQYDRWVAAHRRSGDLHRVLNSRCWARAMAGTELDQALADCNAALDELPKEPAYLDSRGMVHLRQGQWAKARADYDEALKLDPKKPWSLYGRGLVRLRSGDAAEGRADLEAAKALRPAIEDEAKQFGLAP